MQNPGFSNSKPSPFASSLISSSLLPFQLNLSLSIHLLFTFLLSNQVKEALHVRFFKVYFISFLKTIFIKLSFTSLISLHFSLVSNALPFTSSCLVMAVWTQFCGMHLLLPHSIYFSIVGLYLWGFIWGFWSISGVGVTAWDFCRIEFKHHQGK